jgi:hypothetical protein
MTSSAGSVALPAGVAAALRARLPAVAEHTVEAVTREVAEYSALESEVGVTISRAVQLALATFLRLATQEPDGDTEAQMQPALEGAYALGRGEARSGRTMDALLGAYRVGARVSWREWSSTAVAIGLPADALARFAELVFAYIDELSAASAAGHSDELARSGRVREQYRERLALALLGGAPDDELRRRAEQADWRPPASLTAVLLPSARLRGTVPLLDARTLVVSADVATPQVDTSGDDSGVLLVPGDDRTRSALLRALHGRGAVVGPARPWTKVHVSYERAGRLARQVPLGAAEPLDTEAHLLALVLGADPEALADLRAAVVAPLAGLRAATADRLAETLHSWLLHQGRRDDVAAALHVHPQTVRYRMTQVRELFGDALLDPATVLQLVVALAPVVHPARLRAR